MKKVLFLSLLISCVCFAQAQKLKWYYDGQYIPNGDTISVGADKAGFVFKPKIQNTEMGTRICRILIEPQNESEVVNTAVCAGNLCVSGNLSAPFALPGNSTYEEGYIDFDVPEGADPGLFLITVYDTEYVTVKAEFYASIYRRTAAVAEAGNAMLVKALPNPAKGVVKIDYNALNDDAEVVVYDLKGVTVLRRAVSAGEGSVEIDLGALPCGVYLYGLKDGNNSGKLQKLLVR